jgi:rubrerythrin
LVKGTAENFRHAEQFEHHLATQHFPAVIAQAEKEGETLRAVIYRRFLGAGAVHATLMAQAAEAVEAGHDLNLAGIRVCPVCGNILVGDDAGKCPVCETEAARFKAIG